jgi:toxin ParE1/3/4
MKPVVPRERADRDIEDAVAFYLNKHGQEAALGLIDALQDAYTLLSRHPAIGASRYAHELDIPGLRSWSLPRFPYLIFYVERNDHIDVWAGAARPARYPGHDREGSISHEPDADGGFRAVVAVAVRRRRSNKTASPGAAPP